MKASIGPDPTVDIYAATKGGPKPLSQNFKIGLNRSKEKSPNASPNEPRRRRKNTDDSNKLAASSQSEDKSNKLKESIDSVSKD